MEYKPKEFAALVLVSVKTLQRWDKSGFLPAGRTKTGRRVYFQQHVQVMKARQQAFIDRRVPHVSTF